MLLLLHPSHAKRKILLADIFSELIILGLKINFHFSFLHIFIHFFLRRSLRYRNNVFRVSRAQKDDMEEKEPTKELDIFRQIWKDSMEIFPPFMFSFFFLLWIFFTLPSSSSFESNSYKNKRRKRQLFITFYDYSSDKYDGEGVAEKSCGWKLQVANKSTKQLSPLLLCINQTTKILPPK